MTTDLTFIGRDDIEGGATALRFRPQRPLAFKAGQHALWFVPSGGIKPFSMASAPEEDDVILATDLRSGSRMKTALGKLRPGTTVRLLGPLSTFHLTDGEPEVTMLAQGLGIAPLRAILVHAHTTQRDMLTRLIHVGTSHIYRTDTEATATKASYPTSRQDFASTVRAAALEGPRATFMISGTRAFVVSTTTQLTKLGIPRSNIRQDAFYGWSGPRALTTPKENLMQSTSTR